MRLSRVAIGRYGVRLHPCLLNICCSKRCISPIRSLRLLQSASKSFRQVSTIEASPLTSESASSKDFLLKQDDGEHALQTKRTIATALPQTCPGCGALAQESTPGDAGYYSRSRKAIRAYFKRLREQGEKNASRSFTEPDLRSHKLLNHRDQPLTEVNIPHEQKPQARIPETPLCDRCHDLSFNARGQSIAHPSIKDIADSIDESPFRRNHVYHVIDAADFPMSLIPDIFSKLSLAQPRSQNRRSQYDFSSKPTISFIITRSDLLAPTKDIANSMMSYFQAILRKAMGRQGRDLRLGNVHLVSAKRGWWTSDIKESIWKRGGGNWMVGKVNVGKSNLFEVLFPKSSGKRAASLNEERREREIHHMQEMEADEARSTGFLSEKSLLPPPQPEIPFPILPLVSSLPGTTASPIRVPFGKHKGELIDLPGLDRGSLENYVLPEHRLDLVMTHRPTVTQLTIKPGQSLILGGGLIRITPCRDPWDRSTTMLAYAFVPIHAHVTSTEKATELQLQERESGVQSILAEGAGVSMESAGVFDLSKDVTKTRSGPLLRAGVPISRLPFRVYSTDILIEGLGWVELVCQVQRRQRETQHSPVQDSLVIDQKYSEKSSPTNIMMRTDLDFEPFSKQTGIDDDDDDHPHRHTVEPPMQIEDDFAIPKVEVLSPRGKYIAQRQPLGAWLKWSEGRQQRKKQ